MEKKEFAKGIFITEKVSQAGKPYLELAISENGGYKKYIAFKTDKDAKFGGKIYSVYDKADQQKDPEIKPMINHRDQNDLPF